MQNLAEGRPGGELKGLTFAEKDLYDVANTCTGGGNPSWLAERAPATTHAAAVEALLDAGATLVGKTLTDELAFSLSGTNVHYGTPPNPLDPNRVPGGSAAGLAEFTERLHVALDGGALLAQPAASGPALLRSLGGFAKDGLRTRTLTLTCIAGLASAPVLSLPLATVDGLPVALGLVGLPGDDDALVDLALNLGC